MLSVKNPSLRVVLAGGIIASLVLPRGLRAQEDDYEFVPPGGWRGLSETGDDDASSRLAEGFEGLDAEPGKDTSIEPVDGSGGFDNVAPRLGAEEGPGGLEWDPSPTYRTRYKGGTDYAAGSGNRLQGNNWFLKIPYVTTSSSQVMVRFDANTFRVYDQDYYSPSNFYGRLGNKNSKIVRSGSSGYYVYSLYDTRGKTYTFEQASPASGRCTKIQGLGGAEITFEYYYSTEITVLQKPGSAGSAVRKFVYAISGSGSSARIDKIDISEWDGSAWKLYRKIDFTYHEDVTSPAESATGDLVGIKEELLLTPASTWSERKWVFKYYTGTYNASTNPGYPYQVKAVLGPQSVHDWEAANPSTSIYTKTASELSSYVERTYEYESDKRLDELDLKGSCGCGSGVGLHTYAWDVNSSTPSDMNTWYRWVTITLPDPDGGGSQPSPARIIDYNKYGQKLNSLLQEDAGNSSSRRWIETWSHDTTGRLTESFSPKASTSYASHAVTTNSTAGQRFQFSYDSNSALTTVTLRDPSNGNLNYQVKKAFSLVTSGDRRRFVKTSETHYPTETTTDTGGVATSWSYSYHSSDALAVKKRTTTMPTISTGENGSGSAVTRSDYFETDGLHTWSKDGDGFVHYTGWDANRRTVTKTVRNIDTDSADRPSGVPAPPSGEGFDSSTGLNLVSDTEYDSLHRPVKAEGPAFNAWTGSTVASVRTTRRWYYTKLSGGETVTVEYPHVDTAYYHAPVGLTVRDFEGHVLTSAQGSLDKAKRDTTLSDDLDASQSTLAAAFEGTLVQRTDRTYSGDKVSQETVWSVADDTNAPKYTTTHAYDSTGRKEKTTNPAGTITKWSYDVLGRRKTTKLGTVDGGGSDNMTLVEELFYDDEENTSTNVGDGNLTRVNRYTSQGGSARTTDYTYDYRRRRTETLEPLSVKETQTYTNRNQPKVTERLDVSSGSTLMAKSENFYDAWGQVYESRISGVSGGSESGYTSVRTWRNGRGLVLKTLSQGKVFQKRQYDGAGRVVNEAVSYDAAETAYADADDLTGDTVVEETRLALDATGAAELTAVYERRHNGTGTAGLTVGSSGNSRAQYVAAWFDKLHRPSHSATYGTNGGTDLASRPTGNPPSTGSTQLVTTFGYETKGENEETTDVWTRRFEIVTDPMGIKTHTEYNDAGHVYKRIDNYVNGTPGTDDDRTVEYTFNSAGQNSKITAKATSVDQVTENVYGVLSGEANSTVSSNDFVKPVKYPDPSTGQPSTSAEDQETLGWSAQGELLWKKDQLGSEHVYEYDARGRLEHDRVTVLGSGLDGAVLRISRTYDALDRLVKVTSWDTATVGSGSVVNEVQYEYGRYGMVEKIYQEWSGAVNTGTSRKVQFAYSYPSDGTTGLRRTSTTTTGGTVVTDEYNSGMDDTLSRLSGRKQSSNWLFQESYLGLGRLVERAFGSAGVGVIWSLVGTDSSNNDNYVGLDRFGRIDDLTVTKSSMTLNRYLYTYNDNSQITYREDTVGNVSGSYEFSEKYEYDGLRRLTTHKRGVYSAFTTLRRAECFTMNRSGGITQYQNGTAACGSTTYFTLNASNEITFQDEIPYSYSYPGNLTGGNTYNHKYDAWNRLVETTFGSSYIARYKYNGLNQKIKRTDSGTLPDTYYYYNDAWQLIEERKVSDGTVLYWYAYGTQYIDDLVVKATSQNRYFVGDARFNVCTIINYDGTVASRFCYDAYGTPKQLSADWSTWQTITEDLFLFTGRLHLKDHAQYNFRNRMQDPALGYFVTRDPLGSHTEPAGNAYGYVGNDPINRVDPRGLQTLLPRNDSSAHTLFEHLDNNPQNRSAFIYQAESSLTLPGSGNYQTTGCACQEWDCATMCQAAEDEGLNRNSEGEVHSEGAVVCCGGRACPCSWTDTGDIVDTVCVLVHEFVHLDGTGGSCDSKKCLHIGVYPPDMSRADRGHEECAALHAEYECLRSLGGSEDSRAKVRDLMREPCDRAAGM
jgi:RHS repeat-associated protein